MIAFERGRHDDEFPFDGRDGVVAHAFYPLDGRLHFDADESWTLNSRQGVNLFQVGDLTFKTHKLEVDDTSWRWTFVLTLRVMNLS